MNPFECILFLSVILVPVILCFSKRSIEFNGRTAYLCDKTIETGAIFLIGIMPVILSVGRYDPTSIKTPLSETIIFAMLAAWIMKPRERHAGLGLSGDNAVKMFALLFLWSALLSFFYSPFKYASVSELYRIFSYIILFMIISSRSIDQKRIAAESSVIFYSGTLISFYGILQFFGYDFIPWESSGRVLSTLGNPNFLGGYLAAVIPLCLGTLFAEKNNKVRLLKGIAVACMMLCMVFTFTRSSLIALICGVLLFTIVKIYRDKTKKLGKNLLGPAFMLAVIFIMIFCVRLYSPNFRNKFYNIAPALKTTIKEIPNLLSDPGVFRSNAGENVGVRLTLWQAAYSMFLERPIFGWGAGTLEHVGSVFLPSSYKLEGFGGGNLVEHAHSEYLEILAEQGLVGFSFFLIFVLLFFRNNFKKIREMNDQCSDIFLGSICAVFAVLVDNLASVNLRITSNAVIFWYAAGLAVAVGRCGKVKDYNHAAEPAGPAESYLNVTAKKRPVLILSILLFSSYLFLFIYSIRPFISWNHYCNARKKGNSVNDALGECKSAIKYQLTNIEAQYYMGDLYASSLRWKEAKMAYEEVKRLSPYFGRINYNLGLAYFNLNSPKSALYYLSMAVNLDPCDYNAYNTTGVCFSALRQWEKASEAFEKAVEAKKSMSMAAGEEIFFPEAAYNLATAYFKMGRKKEAAALYREVLINVPGDTASKEMLGRLETGRAPD